MTNFITGIIGIMLVASFLTFMLVWVPAPPLIIIVIAVMAMLIVDFVQSLRRNGNGR